MPADGDPREGEREDQVQHQQRPHRPAQQRDALWRSSRKRAAIRPKTAPEAPTVRESGDSRSAPAEPHSRAVK